MRIEIRYLWNAAKMTYFNPGLEKFQLFLALHELIIREKPVCATRPAFRQLRGYPKHSMARQ
jgi:hypothetical protein